MKTSLYVACAVGMALLQCAAAGAQAPGQPGQTETRGNAVALSLPEQPLRDALNGLARQTGLQVIYTAEDVRASLVAPKIEGTFTPQAALNLLLKNSGLHYQFINPRTVAVTQAGANKSTTASAAYQETAGMEFQPRDAGAAGEDTALPQRFTLAQSEPAQTRAAAPQPKTASNESAKEDDQSMTVTGTQIRGASGSASPMMSFDREDILKSGVSSTHQFIQTLPQNFGGGYSETTIGSILGGEGANLNYGMASGANLRGLGSDATLTLLNGRRLAPTSVGESVDLSVIPLAAIERIDVLTDGASAIYGSDAVGGVINIILRQNYDGAETHVRYGDVTNGSNGEFKVGQTIGHNWSTGGAFLSYEYVDRKELSADERSFTADALFLPGVELVPPNRQRTALVSFSQDMGARTKLVGSAVYSDRNTQSTYISGGAVRSPIATNQLSGSVSAIVQLANDWQGDIGAAVSRNVTENTLFQDGVLASKVDMHSIVQSFDAKADGGLFDLAGGEAKLAAGAQYRREGFDSRQRGGNTHGELSRNVTALSTELLLPLVGQKNARSGIRRFEISLAARYEDYSDVGSSTDPKIGIVWAPNETVSVRGTWGTSFRAPTFYESSTVALPLQPIVYTLPDPQNPPTSRVIVLYGNTGQLSPEEATNWTVGVDFKPERVAGLGISVTYFDIEFKNRVAEPLALSSAFNDVLVQEAQHPEIVTRNPALSAVQAYFAMPNFLDFSGGVTTPAQIAAIVSNERTNVATTVQSGLDVSFTYDRSVGANLFSYGLSAARLFEKENRLTPTSQLINSMNQLFQPVDLRVRGSASWNRGNFGTTLFLNYVDSYRDDRPGFGGKVDSWSTADLTIRYSFTQGHRWLDGTTVSFAANNVTDEDPPFIDYYGFNFDATNASAVGRYLSLDVTKRW